MSDLISPRHQPRKRFGQNFLHDRQVIARIIEIINPKPTDLICEIGPGQGAITAGLLQVIKHMDAVELDRDLIPLLEEKFGHSDALTIHNQDALKFDFASLALNNKLRLVGNLPYNISSPLLFHFLAQIDVLQDMHLMLQKEVAERISAEPGSKIYGRLSVMVQTKCTAQMMLTIKAGAFHPAPKVESAFIRLLPHNPTLAPELDSKLHAQIVQQAFSQRRKTLRNSLAGLVTTEQMEAVGIDPNLRAERISVDEFIRLSMHIQLENT